MGCSVRVSRIDRNPERQVVVQAPRWLASARPVSHCQTPLSERVNNFETLW